MQLCHRTLIKTIILNKNTNRISKMWSCLIKNNTKSVEDSPFQKGEGRVMDRSEGEDWGCWSPGQRGRPSHKFLRDNARPPCRQGARGWRPLPAPRPWPRCWLRYCTNYSVLSCSHLTAWEDVRGDRHDSAWILCYVDMVLTPTGGVRIIPTRETCYRRTDCVLSSCILPRGQIGTEFKLREKFHS